ncbi:hypothetical protein GCM10023083_74470 [Streptomyces phyllanthi]
MCASAPESARRRPDHRERAPGSVLRTPFAGCRVCVPVSGRPGSHPPHQTVWTLSGEGQAMAVVAVFIPVLMLGVVLALGRYEEMLLPTAEDPEPR